MGTKGPKKNQREVSGTGEIVWVKWVSWSLQAYPAAGEDCDGMV